MRPIKHLTEAMAQLPLYKEMMIENKHYKKFQVKGTVLTCYPLI